MKKRIDNVTNEVENCSIYKTMELFQSKWSMWILFELNKKNSARFGELRNSIPDISNTMLSATLKDLEEKELIKRIQYNEIPPHVEYLLTDKAKDLKKIFQAMSEWGDKYTK